MAGNSEQPLSTKLALVGAVVFGLVGSLIVGPALFPKEPGQFSVAQVLCAGAGGGLGAALGVALGRLIEGPKK